MQGTLCTQMFKMLFISMTFFCAACAGENSSNEQKAGIADTTAVVANSGSDSFPPGHIIRVVCKNYPAQSYALYIPDTRTDKPIAVIYFFDPHADGRLPLKKYRALADKYNFMLIGSDNSKNGNDWPTTENIWTSLYNDTKTRLPVDNNRIYTCGFSGGAKVASYLAMHHREVKSVIANGAGLPDGVPAANFNFSFTAITGEGDMNMTDLVLITDELDKTQTTHRIIFFEGKHEWAPTATMDIAFAGLQLDAMRNKTISKDNKLIVDYIGASKKRLIGLTKANALIGAERECKLSISMIEELSDEVNFFKEKDAALKNSVAYQKQLQQQQSLFALEENKKAEYNQKFEEGDMNYWKNTINDLNAAAKAQTPEGAMHQRLLAYLSLAFYSISNQFIMNNNNEAARYFVELYKKADPSNSEAWYFSAILDARNNNAQAAKDDLLKAVDDGFNDEERMMQQGEFKTLQIDLVSIGNKMKKENE